MGDGDAMMDPICIECKKQGVIRKAHRRNPDLCNDHYLKSMQVSPQQAFAPIAGIAIKNLRTDDLDNLKDSPSPLIKLKNSEAPPAKQEEKQMPVPRTDVDWAQVQKDYDAGLGAQNIAKKYGVHVSSVYLHVKKSVRPTLAEREKQAEAPKRKPGRPAPASHTGGGYDQVIADLRMKAQKLNEIADQLEGM